MHLKGQDSSSHAKLGLSYDRQTNSQSLALSSTPDLCVIVGREANNVVEIVSANVGLSCTVVIEAR